MLGPTPGLKERTISAVISQHRGPPFVCPQKTTAGPVQRTRFAHYIYSEQLSYGVLPKGLLTFLGFLGNAELSPWKRLPEFNELRKS